MTIPRLLLLTAVVLLGAAAVPAQQASVTSPNQKVVLALYNRQEGETGGWYLKISCLTQGRLREVIPHITLGLRCSDQDFSGSLRLLEAEKPAPVTVQYLATHGKRAQCSNAANEVVVRFENAHKAKLNLILRAYDDGAAFRYEFPGKGGPRIVKDELTAYEIPRDARRWLQKWNTANEGLYAPMTGDSVQQDWGYPALFGSADSACWCLLHEADLDRTYCGSKLSNVAEKSRYKITFPDSADRDGQGASMPTITLPWKSPWRLMILGSLADIVASTLTNDISSPSVVPNAGWVKPGLVSWNYWSNNHGTRDYQVVCRFADLAARMHWPYTLLDAEWEKMGNGGTLEDAVKYILSKGVKPLIWYGSGLYWWIPEVRHDRLRTHENRVAEFAKLKQLGIAGVKVDFFQCEKQDIIGYYLDILEDAAHAGLMVYFHGCLVPRGWERTYPHLMTMEGVRGAEWYNNGPEFTTTAPQHNATLPFTRNVVGSMDYTPVAFTNSQYPHLTSYGHELALSVLFESGLQHMADRPSGFDELPEAVRAFLSAVPAAWDDTRLLDGYPGRDVMIARRKGGAWYVGGINAETVEKNRTLAFGFLPEGAKYRLDLFADGEHDKVFAASSQVVDHSSTVAVKLLRRGGFAASLTPLP